MNILIVEDEKFLAERIGSVFRSKIASNRVKWIYSYEEFEREFSNVSSYDLILTDLKLWPSYENLWGFRVIKAVRNAGFSMPIIVVSGFGEVDSLREAFDLGANDYMIKPIRLKELEVRAMNWFRNYYLSNIAFRGNVYDYGGLSYDVLKNEFSYGWIEICLTKKSKYLLSVFFANPERLMREEFLTEKIWGDMCSTEERQIRVSVMRLKQALEPFGISEWIENVRWEWYVFSSPKPDTTVRASTRCYIPS